MIVLWELFSQKKKKFVYNITQMQLTVFQIKFYNFTGVYFLGRYINIESTG